MTKFNVKNFWIALFVTLAVLSMALAVYFAVTTDSKLSQIKSNVISDENYFKQKVDNLYRQTLYGVEDSLKNLDADLSKVALSNSKAMQTDRLLNVVAQANNLTADVSHLPVSYGENLSKLEKFANQTADFSVSLIKKLNNGQSLTDEDKAMLLSLDAVCSSLHGSVNEFLYKNQGSSIVDATFMDGAGPINNLVNGVENQVFEYEKLIYDGPYSDSIKQAQIPCAKAISVEEGKSIVEKSFGATAVNFVSKVNDKGVMYLYDIKTSEGNGRVSLVCDGRLAEYEFAPNYACKYQIDSSTAMKVAKNFCKQQGFDVEPVWVSALDDSVIYVNLAPLVDNAVVYSDLVKVAVSCNGLVVGAETRAYLTNHQNHNVTFGKLSVEDVVKQINGDLSVVSTRKAIVNKGGNDFACWEVCGDFNNSRYYIYVDSATGNEIEIFRVVEGTEGHTVM